MALGLRPGDGHLPGCRLPPSVRSLSPQALTRVSEGCFPLLDGCRKNRQKWQALAEQQETALVNGEGGQAGRS